MHFIPLWKKIAVSLQLGQLQMKLLLCSYVFGIFEQLKDVVLNAQN